MNDIDKPTDAVDDKTPIAPEDDPLVSEGMVSDDAPVIDDDLLIEDKVETPKETTPVTDTKKDRKDQSVTQTVSIAAVEKLKGVDEIVLPSNYDKETREVLEKAPNIDLLDDVESRQWASDLAEGLELSTYNETYVSSLENDSADFTQTPEVKGVKLSAASPRFKSIENQTLKGERAVVRFISHLGLGGLFQTPLWHSGFWITFKPPSEAEIIEIDRLITNDDITFGRYSYGLSFSNLSSYTTNRLVDYAIAHIYDMTVKSEDFNIGELKDNISCQDIPSLLWGFICTMYPKGFNYRRACINDAEKCNFIIKDTINVSKLQFTDTSTLTDEQLAHMSSRQSKSRTKADVDRYKSSLNKTMKKRIAINEGLSNEIHITVKTPTVSDHIEAGYKWIGDITSMVEKTLGMDSNLDERNAFIVKHGQATAMRQYIHWVESIEYSSNIITDLETLEKTLDVLSSDDNIRDTFTTSVTSYINDSTISVIGIPVFDCPSCGAEQPGSEELPRFTNIIPIDVIQLFFALLTQRIQRLTQR